MSCELSDGDHDCGAEPTRLYLQGRRCADHTPAKLAGRVDVVPDPDLTLEGLRALGGLRT